MQHYQVRPGDTAAGIALRLTGEARRWAELRAYNEGRNWDRLRCGELLTLPPQWSRGPAAPRGIGDATTGGTISLDEAQRRTPWLSSAFFPHLSAIASKYGMPPFELLGVLYQESGVHPSANPNRRSGANGLIQWMPGNVPGGLSMDRLVALDADQQLDLVDQWMRTWASKMGGRPFDSAGKVYATVFCPGRITPNCDEDTIAFTRTVDCSNAIAPGHTKPSNVYDPYCANAGLDVTEPHGKINFRDLTETIHRRMREPSFDKFAIRLQEEGGVTPGGIGGGGSASKVALGLVAVVTLAAFAGVAAWSVD